MIKPIAWAALVAGALGLTGCTSSPAYNMGAGAAGGAGVGAAIGCAVTIPIGCLPGAAAGAAIGAGSGAAAGLVSTPPGVAYPPPPPYPGY